MKQLAMKLIAAFAVLPFVASAATWTNTVSGTYSWDNPSNWLGGTLPTAGTKADFPKDYSVEAGGRQIITGDVGVELSSIELFTANPVEQSAARRFTGNITATSLISRTGTNEIAGTLTLTGATTDGGSRFSRIGTEIKQGTLSSVLDIVSGGSLIADGAHAVCVGRNDDINTQASGRIRLREGGVFRLSSTEASAYSGLFLGRSTMSGSDSPSTAPWFASSYVQDGGYASIGRFILGYEKNANSSFTVAGGVLDMPYISDAATRFIVGRGGYGIFQQVGGAVYVSTNRVQSVLDSESELLRNYAFTVGYGRSAESGLTNSCFYACNGAFVNGNSFLIQGGPVSESGVGVMPASATIDGTAAVTSTVVRVGANDGDGAAILNLNGGELVTKYIWGKSGRAGKSEINANGGTITFPADIADQYKSQFMYINHVNIYEGGLTVRCGRDINVGTASTAVPLRSVGGLGLDVVTRGTRGDLIGCIYPPRIEIYGGSGSNATVVALVDYDRNATTNFVVTCRGEGYTDEDFNNKRVKARIIRANENASELSDSVDVYLSTNKLGSLVKTGAGNLGLFAQPEFYGTYEVREGRLIQSTATTGSERVSAIVVGGNNAVFQCGSGNSSATVAKSNPVNPTAMLTLGTANGPGTLAIPSAANGESAAFSQTFASLTVVGSGNAIELASGNAAANGAKVTFGAINCAEGSTLTLPHSDSSPKVYVTTRPSHDVLERIFFAGTDFHAMVAQDGQLIPAVGLLLLFR